MKWIHKRNELADEKGAAPGDKAKKKKKRKKAPVIIVSVLILLLILRMVSCAMAGKQAAIVTTTHAARGDLQESISTSGTVSSRETKVIFAPVAGNLGEVKVAAGDSVKAGNLLISYDMEQMEDTLRSASLQNESSTAGYQGTMADNSESQAKLNEADTNLAVLDRQIEDFKAYLKQLQHDLSQSQRETQNSLAKEAMELQQKLRELDPTDKEAVAETENQIARNSYLQQVASSSDYVAEMNEEIADVQEHIAACEEYRAEMEAQKSTSEASVLDSYGKKRLNADKELSDLNYQQTEKDYYTAKAGITAEFDGIVTECTALPGQSVARGVQLLTLENSRDLKVSFEASQYDLQKLELGQNADVVIAGETYHGEIAKIDHMAMRNSSNTPMVGVEIYLLDGNDSIILGLDAKLTVYTHKTENALLIPTEAINADKDGDFLYTVEEGVIVKKPIRCGISSDIYTEILEGVTEEDEIVLNSFTELYEGMPAAAVPDTGQPEAGQNDGGASLSITIG